MKRIWCHGASVGDMRALEPLVAALLRETLVGDVVVTAWTEGGLVTGRKLFGERFIGRPPIPMGLPTRRFLKRWGISALVLEYLELYPGWVAECHRLGLPVAVVDGRVTHKSLRIKRYLRRAASNLSLFCARSDDDALRARELGVLADRISVTGNGKYDGYPLSHQYHTDDLPRRYGCPDVVIGSLHPDEQRDALHSLAQLNLRALIAPRYLSQISGIVALAKRFDMPISLYSRGETPKQFHLLDTYGDLATAYGAAPINIVGGSFGRRRGQNLFEAALHNNVVIHGPSTDNIIDEVRAFRHHGAYEVPSWEQAFSLVQSVSRTSSLRVQALGLRGATSRNVRVLIESLRSCSESSDRSDESVPTS